MRRTNWILILCVAALLLGGCQKGVSVDDVVGDYTCFSTVITKMDNRDTSIITQNERVSIARIDDEHVRVQMKSRKWGEFKFDTVDVSIFDRVVNFSADTGVADMPNDYYYRPAKMGGSFMVDSRSLGLTAYVQTNNPLTISFNNKSL